MRNEISTRQGVVKSMVNVEDSFGFNVEQRAIIKIGATTRTRKPIKDPNGETSLRPLFGARECHEF